MASAVRGSWITALLPLLVDVCSTLPVQVSWSMPGSMLSLSVNYAHTCNRHSCDIRLVRKCTSPLCYTYVLLEAAELFWYSICENRDTGPYTRHKLVRDTGSTSLRQAGKSAQKGVIGGTSYRGSGVDVPNLQIRAPGSCPGASSLVVCALG